MKGESLALARETLLIRQCDGSFYGPLDWGVGRTEGLNRRNRAGPPLNKRKLLPPDCSDLGRGPFLVSGLELKPDWNLSHWLSSLLTTDLGTSQFL